MKNSRLKFIAITVVFLALVLAPVLTSSIPAEACWVPSVDVYTDIAYTDPVPPDTLGNLLDLYIPDIPGKHKLPLLIWHSGSAWLFDDFGRMVPPDVVDFFTQRGYAIAGVNVRSSFQVNFPGQLLDIRAAIRWLREHANEYNIDPKRFAIMGTSSGGWLAAIAATTSDIWEFDGETDVQTSSAVQAAVPCFAPTDFLQMDAWYADHPEVFSAFIHDAPLTPLPPNPPPLPPWFFDPVGCSPESLLIGCTNDDGWLLGIQDCPEETEAANPITYIDDGEPLMWIFHGYTDPLVPHGQSELLYEALAAEGNEVWFTSVATGVHDLTTIIDATDYTVYWTNRWGREWVWEDPYGPAPTLKSIDFFINYAFIRARWGAGMYCCGLGH